MIISRANAKLLQHRWLVQERERHKAGDDGGSITSSSFFVLRTLRLSMRLRGQHDFKTCILQILGCKKMSTDTL